MSIDAPIRFAFAAFALTAIVSIGNAQSPGGAPDGATGGTSDTAADLAKKARAALAESDFEVARRYANRIVQSTEDARLRLLAADTLLRCGDAGKSVELFDEYIAHHPQDKPYLWQRGIALYLIGEFGKGAEQFEVHRRVNPNDVENAAWHFLCVAKQQSPAIAKKLLLPAPGDSREPMAQVLEMFRTGDTKAVQAKMDSFDPDSAKAKSANFYGEFYLGLYADALGDSEAALAHLKRSAEDAPPHYMGDVARVYARHLAEADGAKR